MCIKRLQVGGGIMFQSCLEFWLWGNPFVNIFVMGSNLGWNVCVFVDQMDLTDGCLKQFTLYLS